MCVCALRVACCVLGYATRIALPAGSLTKIFRSAATSFVKAGLLESPSTSVSSPVRSKCVLEIGVGGSVVDSIGICRRQIAGLENRGT